MTDYQRIEKVLLYIEKNFRSQPSLKELAGVVGLSEHHFHRLFQKWAGTTPKSFVQYFTAQFAKDLLLSSNDVLTSSLEAGLSGPGRLHDLMIFYEAMTPGEVKKKGRGIEIRYDFQPSPFGHCLIGLTARGICHLSFHEKIEKTSLDELKNSWPEAELLHSPKEIKKLTQILFKPQQKTSVSLLLKGTPFQIKVWEGLLRIPEGKVTSYSRLASLVGVPQASRAVGTAVGRNDISYLIPCHRVIRETGALGGYRWGLRRKQALLAWEQLALTSRK